MNVNCFSDLQHIERLGMMFCWFRIIMMMNLDDGNDDDGDDNDHDDDNTMTFNMLLMLMVMKKDYENDDHTHADAVKNDVSPQTGSKHPTLILL